MFDKTPSTEKFSNFCSHRALNQANTVRLDDKKKAFQISYKTLKCILNRHIQFKILHNRLNTGQLLSKMKFTESEEFTYCTQISDSTMHALIECPYTAQSWRRMELWLRTDVNKNIKIADEEKNLGYTEKKWTT